MPITIMEKVPQLHNARIIKHLATIDQAVYVRFGEFLRSEFFQARPKSLQFYNILSERYPKWEDLDSQSIIQQLYLEGNPSKTMSRWKQECNFLLNLFEKFVAHHKLDEDPVLEKNLFLDTIDEIGLQDSFSVYENGLRKVLQKQPIQGISILAATVKLEAKKTDIISKYEKRNHSRNLGPLIDALDRYYFRFLIPILTTRIQRQITFGSEIEDQSSDHFIEYCKAYPLGKFPLAQLYFEIFLCFQSYIQELQVSKDFTRSLNHFQKATAQVLEQFPLISEPDLNNLYTYLVSYGIKRYNGGNVEILSDLFSFIKAFLDQGTTHQRPDILFIGDQHARDTAKSIIRIALLNKQIDWAKNFIITFFQYFPKGTQEPLHHYFLSLILFEEGKYVESRKELLAVDETKLDQFYDLAKKELLLKIFICLPRGHEDIDVNFFISFQKSLKEKLRTKNGKLEYKRVQGTENYVRICLHLFLFKHDGKPLPKRIQEEIHSLSPLRERKWLIQIYEELLNE